MILKLLLSPETPETFYSNPSVVEVVGCCLFLIQKGNIFCANDGATSTSHEKVTDWTHGKENLIHFPPLAVI